MLLKDETILAVGMISLALGLLIGQFLYFEVGGVVVTTFLEGILIGIALVMNFAYLVKTRMGRKAK
jgi:hypothetical protein